MKKMAPVSVLLLCCFAVVSRGCDRFDATGKNLIVSLNYKLKTDDRLKWRFNDTVIFSQKSGNVIWRGSSDVNAEGSLILTNLQKNQDGLYQSEVFDSSGILLATERTHLCVLDPVKKPTVDVKCNKTEVTFICGHDQRSDGVRYKWLQNGIEMNKTTISLKRNIAETKNDVFSCEVSNSVSSEISNPSTHTCISTYPVKKPTINATCKDSKVFLNCLAAQQPGDARYKWFKNGNAMATETKASLIKEITESKNVTFSCEVYNNASSEKSGSFAHSCTSSSLFGLPEKVLGISIWVFIAGGGVLLLVLIIIITVCCVGCKRKRKRQQNDEEEPQYQAATSSSQSYCSP